MSQRIPAQSSANSSSAVTTLITVTVYRVRDRAPELYLGRGIDGIYLGALHRLPSKQTEREIAILQLCDGAARALRGHVGSSEPSGGDGVDFWGQYTIDIDQWRLDELLAEMEPEEPLDTRRYLTANAELSISRDLMRVDALLLGPAHGTPEVNAYTETRVPLCLHLPDGWEIAESRGGGWKCYDGDHRIELAVHNVTRSGRVVRNWFWAGGSRWVVYVCGSAPWYMSQTISATTEVL